MSKRKLNALFQKLTYENAKKQSELILQEEDELNKAPIPAESRRRFESMLEQKFQSKPQTKRFHRISWSHKRIAVAVAVCIAVLLLIPASSEAVRGRITQFIRTIFSTHTEVRLSDYHELQIGDLVYTVTYIPKGYKLIEDQSVDGLKSLAFQNEEQKSIRIDINPASSVIGLDTENAIVEPITIMGEEGFTIQKGEWSSVTWSTDENIFDVFGTAPLNEIILVAKGLKKE